MSARSLESANDAASDRPPDARSGFAARGETVQRTPSLAKRISSADRHANAVMSDVRISGSTGKSVSWTGGRPGVATKRSCLPHASQRNATIVPSGDQTGDEGYLMREMRSIVMLPRGASAVMDGTTRVSSAAQSAAGRDCMADDSPSPMRSRPPTGAHQRRRGGSGQKPG